MFTALMYTAFSTAKAWQLPLLKHCLPKKGMSSDDIKVINFDEYKKQQYDILADNIRKNIDMKKVYEILEAGI